MAAPQACNTQVLDTWPVMEWMQEREPVTTFFDLLIEQAIRSETRLLVSRINFGEVLYSCWKPKRDDSAQLVADFEALPIEVVSVDDLPVNEAAHLKAQTTASYADCFAAALALRHRAPVITGDHHLRDLQRVQPDLQLHGLGA